MPLLQTRQKGSSLRHRMHISPCLTIWQRAPLYEERDPRRHADYSSAEDADTVFGAATSTLELCRLENLANIFNEDIANSDKNANAAMY
ncbi:hypothetical protein ElyMa_007017200 [Elysia marginata]|uniref:Uncharacterized protein n=1 Tax=Elysia marginata TaxID=1093978 RepID=A0AAV4JU48_9GAST|nr:hypothetical protein ElyMa_007017200 [Elysia marginata]